MRYVMTDARRATAAALLVASIALLLAAIDPAFFVRDDFQIEFLPASKEVIHALGDGEFPLLSRNSWLCAAVAAEYQFGVFSLFRMLLEGIAWLLPISLLARGTLLFIVHESVAAAGGYLLARSYGVRPANAMMVALVAGLNGWILWWGTTWYAITASYAWLPWYWLALRGIVRGRRWSWAGAVFALYLLITAGAPYVVLMAAAVAAMSVLAALARKARRAAWTMIGASALGLALSAPAVLMLLEYFPATARSTAATAFESYWVVPLRGLFGFVVPAFTTTWPVFSGPGPHAAVELLGAFVALAAIAMSFRKLVTYYPELALALVLLVLMLLPSAGPFRWSFRWLPLFHLVLAVLGARALEHARRAWLAGLVLLTITVLVAMDLTTLAHAAVLAVLCVAWAFLPSLAHAMPAIITSVAIVMTFLSFSHRTDVPVWRYDDAQLLAPAPLDPSRRYLAMYDLGAVIAPDENGHLRRGVHPELRPGNLPMMAGLEFVNAYSPMGLAALKDLLHLGAHGPMPAEHADSILRYETGPQQLLHQMGVDGLIVPEALAQRYGAALSRIGWRPVMKLANCVVYHREERLPEPLFAAARAVKAADNMQAYAAIFTRETPQLPVVLLTPGMSGQERYGRRAIGLIEEGRNHTSFVVQGKGPKALVVFRRPWMPGWRATIDGKPLPVLRAHLIMPAVEIPPDAEGRVMLVYRPRSLVIGGILAIAAIVIVAALSLRMRTAGIRAG